MLFNTTRRAHERATEHPRAMLVAALEMTLEFAVGLRASALGGGSVMGRLKKNHFMVYGLILYD